MKAVDLVYPCSIGMHVSMTSLLAHTVAHCFVQDIKVAFEISPSIWQKTILNRLEQFWVEIYLKTLSANHGQITQPSIDLKVL